MGDPLYKESITCFTQSETVYEKSVSSKVKRSPRWHSKAPASVSLDKSLSSDAKVVYFVMGLKTKDCHCTVGMRYLGKLLNLSAATVMRRVDELVRAGHLERIPVASGQRAQYRFTSPAFLIRCPKCKRLSDQIRESGLCWICDERLATARKTA